MTCYPIVNIRGTSGSGKTTVARRVMEQLMTVGRYQNVEQPDVIAGKNKITGHKVGSVFFAGRYATDCGGCDSMSWKGAADYICDLVLHKATFGPVVFEGLMISSWGNGRLRDLWEKSGHQLHVLQLTTTLEECLRSVNERRERKWREAGKPGNPPLLDPENTTSKWKSAQRGATLMQEGGMDTVEFLDREAAFRRTMELVS